MRELNQDIIFNESNWNKGQKEKVNNFQIPKLNIRFIK